MGQGVRVAALQEGRLLMCCLINRVIHKDLATDVGKGRIEAARDQDAPIVETNSAGIALQNQVFRNILLNPAVLGKVVLEDHLWVVRVAKKVVLRNRFKLIVEELKSMLVRKVYDVILESSDVFKQLSGS